MVRGNEARRTMRGIGVEGGSGTTVEGNTAFRCDTGALIERGATGTRVSGNRFERCRIGVLTWDDEATVVAGNEIVARANGAWSRTSRSRPTTPKTAATSTE
ncbi:MAG: right-handed parallel beta-helix repeat-containing protein [Acidimicrobiia bacterium]|nr:right-handed parallel beta-helix repeat-containing protein [Acidimicrobiia bacterium]